MSVKKMFAKKNLRRALRSRYFFLALSVLFSVTLVVIFVSGVGFLARSVDRALSRDPAVDPPLQFDIAGFEGLGLVKQAP